MLTLTYQKKERVIPTIQIMNQRPMKVQTTNFISSRVVSRGLFKSQANACFMISSLSKYIQEPGPVSELGG